MTQQLNKLQRVVNDVELQSRLAEFQTMLNKKPNDEWVQSHPFIKGYKYIPIQRIEYLLRSIFQEWEWKVNEFKVIANSICVHGTLRIKHPITNEWLHYDGLGAVDIQTSKGSNPTDFNSIVPNAIQKNLPAAESYALKDAAEKLGEVFGASLNRKDVIEFKSAYTIKTQWHDESTN